MQASYKKSGSNYLPVILHASGRKEVLWGNPLCTIASARKYAELTIHEIKRRAP